MNDEEGPPLSAAFDLDYDGPSKDEVEKVREYGQVTGQALGIGSDHPEEFWQAASANVLKALKPALATPMSSFLADGWNKYRPFLKYRDAKRFPPHVPIQEQLLEHTIHATLKPRVKIMMAGKKVGEVHFTADFALKLEGGALTIQNGRFMKLRPGTAWLEGTLKCGNAVISRRESRKIELPGEIRFGERGIPIGPRTTEDEREAA